MEKVLSIIVPTYNAEQFLKDNLESFCIEEVLPLIEVLVINDGSTDGSAELAMEYVKRYPDSIRLITKENGGHGSGINCGISNATGKYYKVVDADDWVEKKGFVNLVKQLAETDADMVLSNYQWVDDATGKKSYEVQEICPGISYGVETAFEEVADRIFLKMHAITYKTEIIRSQPERLDEKCYYVDIEYVAFPLPYVKTVLAVKDTVYQYRIGLSGQSMNPEKLQKNCMQHERVLRRILGFYKEHGTGPAGTAICNLAARMAVSQYKIYLSFPTGKKEDMVQMEKELKKNYKDIYLKMRHPAVRLLRATAYGMYPVVSKAVQWRLG